MIPLLIYCEDPAQFRRSSLFELCDWRIISTTRPVDKAPNKVSEYQGAREMRAVPRHFPFAPLLKISWIAML
jgi:hypothetical protein